MKKKLRHTTARLEQMSHHLAARESKLVQVTHQNELLVRDRVALEWYIVAMKAERETAERVMTSDMEDMEIENADLLAEADRYERKLAAIRRERDDLMQALRQQMHINSRYQAMYARMEVVEEIDRAVVLEEQLDTDVYTGDEAEDEVL